MKAITSYQQWLIENFGGSTPKESINLKIESLLKESKQSELPINLASIARLIGVNPIPIYCKQPHQGSLIIQDNELRISLRMQTEKPPSPNWYGIPRMRFTYAHELAHCFSYDVSAKPPKRIAPKPKAKEEEYICNYSAGRFLLPPYLLRQYFNQQSGDVLNKIRTISMAARVSMQVVVLKLFEYDILSQEASKLYILSLETKGQNNESIKKPRCLLGIYYDNLERKHNFLNVFQGIDHWQGLNSKHSKWSLLRFHELIKDGYKDQELKVENEIIESRNNKKIFEISGTHKVIGQRNDWFENHYVWSELNINEIFSSEIKSNFYMGDINEAMPI